jgi:hypothetical protein
MVVSDKLHAPATLPLGKEPRDPWGRRLVVLHSRYGRGSEEEKYYAIVGNRTPVLYPAI